MTESDVVTVRGLRKAYGSGSWLTGWTWMSTPVRSSAWPARTAPGRRPPSSASRACAGRTPARSACSGYDPVTQAARLRPLIGSQLQDSALPDRLRVAEALDLFATARARDGGELLEQFGLAQRRRSAFASLSGGERQRLFLVLALLNRPRLVILDELTQGLDPAARRNVWDAVRQLHDRRHDGAAGHARDGRGRGALRPDRRDAGGPGARRRHAGRAGGPARPAGDGHASAGRTASALLAEIGRLDGVRDVQQRARGSPCTATGA